jgi:hypothetical protein
MVMPSRFLEGGQRGQRDEMVPFGAPGRSWGRMERRHVGDLGAVAGLLLFCCVANENKILVGVVNEKWFLSL